jgi:hypothetical protein
VSCRYVKRRRVGVIDSNRDGATSWQTGSEDLLTRELCDRLDWEVKGYRPCQRKRPVRASGEMTT